MADNWLTNMGNAMKNTPGSKYYNDLFNQGDYGGIIEDAIKQSGGYGTMSPFYYKYLQNNAKRYMLQEGLKQIAAGVPPDEALNGERLAGSLGAAMQNPEGYIFQSGKESQDTFRQALSNLSAWLDPKYKGTAAYNMAATLFEDPQLLQAMMMQSMGEGYGGIFRKGLMNQLQSQFAELERFPNRGNDWWNTMFGMYSGFTGDKGAPGALTSGPITQKPSKPYASTYPGASNTNGLTGSGGQPTTNGGGSGMGDVQRQGQPAAGAGGQGAGGQGDLTAAQIEANANKPENIGTNFEAVSVWSNGQEYKYAKGRDGLWHVMPAADYANYRSPGGGGAGDAGAGAAAVQAATRQGGGAQAAAREPYYGTPQELQVVIDAGGALPGLKDNEQSLARMQEQAYKDWYFSPLGRTAGTPFTNWVKSPGQPEGYNQGGGAAAGAAAGATAGAATSGPSADTPELDRILADQHPDIYQAWVQSGSGMRFSTWARLRYPGVVEQASATQIGKGIGGAASAAGNAVWNAAGSVVGGPPDQWIATLLGRR